MATLTPRYAEPVEPELLGYDLSLSETEANVLASLLGQVRLGDGTEGSAVAYNILRDLEDAGIKGEFNVGYAEYFEGTREWIGIDDADNIGIVFAEDEYAQDPD
jgi:hypothetical protein